MVQPKSGDQGLPTWHKPEVYKAFYCRSVAAIPTGHHDPIAPAPAATATKPLFWRIAAVSILQRHIQFPVKRGMETPNNKAFGEKILPMDSTSKPSLGPTPGSPRLEESHQSVPICSPLGNQLR
uniref:Uncharacterized protein n=1 Tax=Eutreptiella gymnastica TaxID=73025 RepID=A0A7S4CAW3_9EUGL